MAATEQTVFKLVERPISSDTIEFLRELLSRAERGEIIGFAGVVMHVGGEIRNFSRPVAGECVRNPHWTRGMLKALDDKLAALGESR